jgi:hypothetical protein
LAEPARRAQARALSVFTPRERASFLALLAKFTCAFGDQTRVPLETNHARERRANEIGRPARDRNGALFP